MKKTLLFIKSNLQSYLNIAFWFLFIAIDIRLLEVILITVEKGSFGLNLLNNFYGILMDILTFARYSIIIFPIFFIIGIFSVKVAKWSLRIIFSVLILISIALIYYYIIARTPLDRVFFIYSLDEIVDIVKSSKSIVWWEYVILFGFPLTFLYVSDKKVNIPNFAVYIFVIFFILSIFIRDVPKILYKSQLSYYSISNKQDYFINSIFKSQDSYTFNKKHTIDKEYVLEFQSYFPENEFIGVKYPFLHIDNSPDVLSSFFELKETPPNFVVIIVEGLSRHISGKNSMYPSATPFLDSLASQGLYWENCFSSSNRTFNALPTIFGALPLGKTGFTDLKNDVPEFYSFPLIFKNNGYYSSFFYGGWLPFDNMNHFLELNKIDNYFDADNYPNDTEKNSWGVYDHVLFRESMKTIDFSKNIPRLDIYMTLTTHAPFEFPNKDYYLSKYKELINKQNKHKKVNYEGSLLGESSFMYFDESIHQLINYYKEKPGYENTIFIITGDHSYNITDDYWRSYHVPLIVWSPMQKKSKKVSALVSHRDIAPSLVSLMNNNFNFDTPDKVAWINNGLDTVSYFRSKTFIPQFNGAHNFANMIYRDKFIYDNNVYRFSYNEDILTLDKPTDDSTLIRLFNLYGLVDAYVMDEKVLIEDEFNLLDYRVENIYDISEESDVLKYYKTKTNTIPSTYHEKENTLYFKENNLFPFDILDLEFDENIQNVKIACDFDFYIESKEISQGKHNLFVVYQIKSKNGDAYHWSNYNILEYNNEYDQWQTFSIESDLKKKNYLYSEGDKLFVFFWNPNLLEFFMSNFRLKVDVFK